jgi:hypothetical protein
MGLGEPAGIEPPYNKLNSIWDHDFSRRYIATVITGTFLKPLFQIGPYIRDTVHDVTTGPAMHAGAA